MVNDLCLQKNRRNIADLGCGVSTYATGADCAATEITAGGTRSVVFKPALSGLLQGQSNWLAGSALGQSGMTVSLELCGITGCINRESVKTQSWSLVNSRAHGSTTTLSSDVNDSCASHPLPGKACLLTVRCTVHVMRALPDPKHWDIIVARAFT